jgi:hypothetical protein
MAWRIHDQVVRAEIDARERGRVTGAIWLAGRSEPLRLELVGTAHADLAGCRAVVTNPAPVVEPLEDLAAEQRGVCGDLTVSRKVRIPTVPVSDWLAAHPEEPLPCTWGNSVYLEWFSERNGRVVVESHAYTVELSDPEWRLSEEEAEEQERHAVDAMTGLMERWMSGGAAAADADTRSGFIPPVGCEKAVSAEQQERIDSLERQIQALGGQTGAPPEIAADLPPDLKEAFLREVLDFETAPEVKRREILAEDGFRAAAPQGLSDEAVRDELWRLISALAARRIYLEDTDHLSDRELYELLVNRVLEEETQALSPEFGWNCRINVADYGFEGDEDPHQVFLRYYADDLARDLWAGDAPGEVMPPHEDPPYDRDQWLPQPEC